MEFLFTFSSAPHYLTFWNSITKPISWRIHKYVFLNTFNIANLVSRNQEENARHKTSIKYRLQLPRSVDFSNSGLTLLFIFISSGPPFDNKLIFAKTCFDLRQKLTSNSALKRQ